MVLSGVGKRWCDFQCLGMSLCHCGSVEVLLRILLGCDFCSLLEVLSERVLGKWLVGLFELASGRSTACYNWVLREEREFYLEKSLSFGA